MTAPNLALARQLLAAHFAAAQRCDNQLEAARLAGVVVGLWEALGFAGVPYE